MDFESIFTERFQPSEQNIIYHYCNDFVFKSICNNKKIWLSDIYAMNDSSEFEWGREMFIRVLKDNKHDFEQSFRFYIIGIVMSAISETLPVIACFSKNGDLLSQWRAYADNGCGFSIGFSAKYIQEGLGVNINSVIYNEEEQYKLVLNTLRGLHAWWKIEGENYEEIADPSMGLSIDLAYLKNPSFFEEQEIRIIRLLVKYGENFIDIGGNSEINQIYPLNIQSRKSGSTDISYIELPINYSNEDIIKEIVIGPKNQATVSETEELLSKYGLKNIVVKKSRSTYR